MKIIVYFLIFLSLCGCKREIKVAESRSVEDYEFGVGVISHSPPMYENSIRRLNKDFIKSNPYLNIISEVYSFNDSTEKEFEMITFYDEKSRLSKLIKKDYHDNKIELITELSNTYKDGQIIESKKNWKNFRFNNQAYNITKYEYDEKLRLSLEHRRRFSNDELIDEKIETYGYDSIGRLKEINYIDYLKKIQYDKTTKNYFKDRINTITSSNVEDTIFNSKGKVVKVELYRKGIEKLHPISITEFNYDQKGKKTERIERSFRDDVVNFCTKHDYQYDLRGNLIKSNYFWKPRMEMEFIYEPEGDVDYKYNGKGWLSYINFEGRVPYYFYYDDYGFISRLEIKDDNKIHLLIKQSYQLQ